MKMFFLVFALLACHANAATPQSFDILLTGKTETGPNRNEEAATRKLVAGFIENLKVKKYQLREKPANGGFRVCIDPLGDDGYNFIVGELNTIAVRESIWEINLVDDCKAEKTIDPALK